MNARRDQNSVALNYPATVTPSARAVQPCATHEPDERRAILADVASELVEKAAQLLGARAASGPADQLDHRGRAREMVVEVDRAKAGAGEVVGHDPFIDDSERGETHPP